MIVPLVSSQFLSYAGNWEMRKTPFTETVLKDIAMLGIVLLSGRHLSSGVRAARKWKREYEHKQRADLQKALRNLSHRKLVMLQYTDNGELKATITSKGKKIVRRIEVDSITLPRQEHWDGTWHVVIFDIPNKKSKNRSAFTQHIRNMGFQLMQKSVWAYPYACHEEIMILRKFYGIEKYVMYIETKTVEDEPVWKSKFDLD